MRNQNRLIEVVRYQTTKYWITPINEHDIIFFEVLENVDDSGKKRTGWIHTPDALVFPIYTKNQRDVQGEIAEMLNKEYLVRVYENLLLDSFYYFATGRFNESVIIANIALEEMVKNYLYDKLVNENGYSEEEADKKISAIFSDKKVAGKRGLHKAMSINFKETDGRSLEDNSELWFKFNEEQHRKMLFIHTPNILTNR